MPDGDDDDQYFGLAEVLRAIGRRWRWTVAALLVIVGISQFLSFQQSPKYVASVRLLMRTVAEQNLIISDPNAEVPFFADRQLRNEIQVIESVEVQQAVAASYPGEGDVQSVSAEIVEEGSDVVELSVSASDAQEAADQANLYAQTYIDYNQSENIESLAEANAQIQARLTSITERRDAAAAPLLAIEAELATDPDNVALQEERATLGIEIGAEVEALNTQRTFYLRMQENLALSRELAPQAIAQVLSPAAVPSDPVSPRPLRNGIIGLILGLGVGLALALAREFLDQSIRTTDDLERAVRGRYPLLAVIPNADSPDRALLGPGGNQQFAVAEAFRALRTSVRFAELDRPMKVIQITSSAASEGKTTVTANLARAFTQAGHSVGVSCCDLRRPAIHELFDAPMSPGFADVVVGDSDLASAIRPVDDLTFLLPAGTTPPNPSELLGSGRAERVIEVLSQQMDYTVLDTTPVLPVTDSIVVSRFADATIVVVRAGRTTRTQLNHTLTALEQASAPIIGVVLNCATPGDRTAYDYGYEYGYSRNREREADSPFDATPTSVG